MGTPALLISSAPKMNNKGLKRKWRDEHPSLSLSLFLVIRIYLAYFVKKKGKGAKDPAELLFQAVRVARCVILRCVTHLHYFFFFTEFGCHPYSQQYVDVWMVFAEDISPIPFIYFFFILKGVRNPKRVKDFLKSICVHKGGKTVDACELYRT